MPHEALTKHKLSRLHGSHVEPFSLSIFSYLWCSRERYRISNMIYSGYKPHKPQMGAEIYVLGYWARGVVQGLWFRGCGSEGVVGLSNTSHWNETLIARSSLISWNDLDMESFVSRYFRLLLM